MEGPRQICKVPDGSRFWQLNFFFFQANFFLRETRILREGPRQIFQVPYGSIGSGNLLVFCGGKLFLRILWTRLFKLLSLCRTPLWPWARAVASTWQKTRQCPPQRLPLSPPPQPRLLSTTASTASASCGTGGATSESMLLQQVLCLMKT